MITCKDIVPPIGKCYYCIHPGKKSYEICYITNYCSNYLLDKSCMKWFIGETRVNVWFLQAIELMKDNPKSWAKEWKRKRDVAQLLR